MKHAKPCNKQFYAIYHCFDIDGGFGDAVPTRNHVGTVFASQAEIKAYLEKWNKPRVYDRPYCDLTDHRVEAVQIDIVELETLQPYDPCEPTNFDEEEGDFEE